MEIVTWYLISVQNRCGKKPRTAVLYEAISGAFYLGLGPIPVLLSANHITLRISNFSFNSLFQSSNYTCDMLGAFYDAFEY